MKKLLKPDTERLLKRKRIIYRFLNSVDICIRDTKIFYAARAQIEPLIYHIESFYNELQRLQEEINNLK